MYNFLTTEPTLIWLYQGEFAAEQLWCIQHLSKILAATNLKTLFSERVLTWQVITQDTDFYQQEIGEVVP